MIENHICKIWGFQNCFFNTIEDTTINAMTIGMSENLDVYRQASQYITTKNGYKFKPEAKASMICIATLPLINNKTVPDDECFAILLHEIGHSFAIRGNSKMGKLLALDLAMTLVGMVISVISNPENIVNATASTAVAVNTNIRITISDTIKKLYDNKLFSTYMHFMDTIKTIINGIFNVLYSPITFGITMGLAIPFKLIGSVYNILHRTIFKGVDLVTIGKGNEFLADDFATTYGFGPELALAMQHFKLDYTNVFNPITMAGKLNKKNPIRQIVEFAATAEGEFAELIDEHPTDRRRVQQIRKSLLHDLDSVEIPDYMKADIRKDIIRMCNTCEDIQINYTDDAVETLRKTVNRNNFKDGQYWADEIIDNMDYIDKDFNAKMKK